MSEVKEEVLLLGMVYSNEMVPKIGQEYRDRVRCIALENLGYSVKTLDDKHDDNKLVHGKHCTANFCHPRRMLIAMTSKWGDNISLHHVILDYFFSPVGWARTRWSDAFFTDTLPELAKKNVLFIGGKIWLPNLQCIRESIDRFRISIDKFYTVHPVADPKQNPLFVATENAYDELIRCPQSPTNKLQLELQDPTFPFFALVLNDTNNTRVEEQYNHISGDSNFKRQKFDDDDDYAGKSLLMWDAIIATPKNIGDTVIVRVFTGGIDSVQSGAFIHAMSSVQKRFYTSINIVLETLTTSELCKNKWQPDQFVEWLLNSHVHFILAHIHQSLLLHNLVWDMEIACQQYYRLKYHLGFPSGDQLRCPVFTQDKIKYIECLQQLTIKTMTIPLTIDGIYDNICLAGVQR